MDDGNTPLDQLIRKHTDPRHDRPKTRGDCIGGPRPCPWVGCRHHFGLKDIPHQAVKIERHVLDEEGVPYDDAETCVLDVVDRGSDLTLEQVGAIFGITRERIRQIEAVAIVKAQDAWGNGPRECAEEGCVTMLAGGIGTYCSAHVRGHRRKLRRCKDCGVYINPGSVRCQVCNVKVRAKNSAYNRANNSGNACIDCGHAIKRGAKRCTACYVAMINPHTGECVDCGTKVARRSKRCARCHFKSQIGRRKHKGPAPTQAELFERMGEVYNAIKAKGTG